MTMCNYTRRDFMKAASLGAAAVVVPGLLNGSVSAKNAGKAKPNILLILVDDMGYSDLGCYGSEIKTPNLDELAANGLRMTQFYNTARCCPSRASLLTGLYPHQAGVGYMNKDNGTRGYRGFLQEECVTIAQVLKPAGYNTYACGKWHVGTASAAPDARGFDEFYGFAAGAAINCWNPESMNRLPEGRTKRSYPKDKFYATDAITDHALDFIADSRKNSNPFLLYLAYNAPHFPLHAPKADTDRYMPIYEKGWDVIRKERFEKMKKLGLIEPDAEMSPRELAPPHRNAGEYGGKPNPAWDSLSVDRRLDLARRMAIYAAMIEIIDRNIGRILDDLKAAGEMENTLIMFMSDNGACAEFNPIGFDHGKRKDGKPNKLHIGAELDKMGLDKTSHSVGSGWANVSNTPLTLYKHYTHEGGISSPFIAFWPAGMKRKGEIDQRLGHIIDVMTTCVDIAGVVYPKKHNGVDIIPMEGESLLPVLRGAPPKERTLFFEHEGNRAIRKGKWKLVSAQFRGNRWELYDLAEDRQERNDLAAAHPERVKKMVAEYDAWAERCFVIQRSN